MASPLAATICFIACHTGPADHFRVFSEVLKDNGHEVEIYATGPALKKFQDNNIEVIPFSLDGDPASIASDLVAKCTRASTMITDVGDLFDITLQHTFRELSPKTQRIAYYDNPEYFVPGGYSETAAKVLVAADKILFANANLTDLPLFRTEAISICIEPSRKIGLGYYPTNYAKMIAKRRSTEKKGLQEAFFKEYSIETPKQIIVYAGGNNDAYFKEALLSFLDFLSFAVENGEDLSHFAIVLQQHPGAKDKGIDSQLFKQWVAENMGRENAPKLLISNKSTDDALVMADCMLYYQTSMGPQFVLAGIPTIQVGHKLNYDILTRNGLCFIATTKEQLTGALGRIKTDMDEEALALINEKLGIKDDWKKRLLSAISMEK